MYTDLNLFHIKETYIVKVYAAFLQSCTVNVWGNVRLEEVSPSFTGVHFRLASGYLRA